jgi:hypothetical protein
VRRFFLIPSLLAAGLLPVRAPALPLISKNTDLEKKTSLFKLFTLDHRYTLAAHRSHSSHASHASHASHRSSTGGGFYTPPPAPAPLYTPPTVAPPPISVPLVILPGNTDRFKAIVRQLQTALYTYGYYTGPITGIVDPHTGAAIARMQTDYGIHITGTVTPEVLDALGIVAH